MPFEPGREWWLRGGGGEVFAAEDGYRRLKGGAPVAEGIGFVRGDRFDVEGQGETFRGTVQVEERGSNDAIDEGEGVIEGRDAAGETVDEVLVLVEGGEDRAIAPEQVDIAGEAGGDIGGDKVQMEAESFELGGGIHGPGVAFDSEEGGTGGVEGAEGLEEGWVTLGLGDLLGGVRIFAQIDEARDAGLVRRPWDDEDGVVCSALGGPFKEHLFSVAAGAEETRVSASG